MTVRTGWRRVCSLESTLLSVRPPSSQAAFSSEKLVESTSCCDQRTTPGASSKQKLSQGSNSSSTPRQYPNNWQQCPRTTHMRSLNDTYIHNKCNCMFVVWGKFYVGQWNSVGDDRYLDGFFAANTNFVDLHAPHLCKFFILLQQ